MIEKLDKDCGKLQKKINELVNAVNELQTKVNKMAQNLNFAQPDVKENFTTDPYAEQRKWEGKLCWFWDENPEDKIVDVLSCIDISDKYPYVMCDHQVHYKHCEPVKPDDDIIYQELTPEYLRNLMATPKYWKEKDPEIIRKVEQGFKKLYGDKGE